MFSIREKLEGKETALTSQHENHQVQPVFLEEHREGSFFLIDLSLITTDPDQPRKHFVEQSLTDLCESIKKTGVLQPVIIRKDTNDKIWLVAARMAGLEQIPAILTKGNPHEISLIENLQREDLTPIEEAEALQRLTTDYRHTHEDLSRVVGKGRSTITEILSLNKLPEAIKDQCRSSSQYPRRLLVEIARCKNEVDMLSLFEQVQKGLCGSDQIRSLKKNASTKPPKSPLQIVTKDVRNLSLHMEKLDLDILDEHERLLLRDELKPLMEHLTLFLENVGAPTF
jgi:ParB family chromosome partitioning protein